MTTVTGLIANASTTGAANTRTTAGFTPAVGDILVTALVITADTGTPTSVTDSQGGTYYLVPTSALWAASVNDVWIAVRTAPVPAASNTTVTWNLAASTNTGSCVWVIGVAGMGTGGSSVVRQAAADANQASGHTPAPTFGSAALTTSVIVTAEGESVATALVQPSGFTDMGFVSYLTPTTGGNCSARPGGFTGTAVTYGSAPGGTNGALAVELDSTVTPPRTPDVLHVMAPT